MFSVTTTEQIQKLHEVLIVIGFYWFVLYFEVIKQEKPMRDRK